MLADPPIWIIASIQAILTVRLIAAMTGVVLAFSKKKLKVTGQIAKKLLPTSCLMLPNTLKTMSLGALAIAGLSSCSLPSEQAWREIRQEGLISYYKAKDGSSAEKPTVAVKAQPTTGSASVTTTTSVPQPQALTTAETANQPLPTAQAVPGLEGYVRTPFTTPSRLVDVRGMAGGSKVICPYTRRPFLVPNTGGERQVVSTSAPTPKPAPAAEKPSAPKSTKPAPSVTTTVPEAPTKVAASTTPAPQPPPAPAPQTKPNPPVEQTPPPAPAVTAELPMGISIPGRPGFVNSPFAAKHQLVDVTGLPTGMEVKCPYTGKLFRVPPQTSNAPGN